MILLNNNNWHSPSLYIILVIVNEDLLYYLNNREESEYFLTKCGYWALILYNVRKHTKQITRVRQKAHASGCRENL